MLASSLVLTVAIRHGWRGLALASGLLWLGAQFGLGRALYDGVVALTNFQIPWSATGAFDILAWQMLWLAGLWLGARAADGEPLPDFPRWLIVARW